MRSRTRMIAAGAAVTAALAGGGAALASATGAKPGVPAKTASASQKPGASTAPHQAAQGAITASVARQLHVSVAQVSAALQPMFAAGYADPSSPAFVAAARALGVSTAQLNSALVHAKLSVSAAVHARQVFAGTKASSAKANGSKSAEEKQGHDAITSAVARTLHVSTARVSAALQPIFAAGYADPSSPAFATAARALGVSTAQLNSALASAKQSLAAAS
jgi:predicted anti-sigma-YlaC factor YlaD